LIFLKNGWKLILIVTGKKCLRSFRLSNSLVADATELDAATIPVEKVVATTKTDQIVSSSNSLIAGELYTCTL
jgi:hypothetical protein